MLLVDLTSSRFWQIVTFIMDNYTEPLKPFTGSSWNFLESLGFSETLQRQAFGCVLLSSRHILFRAFSGADLFARWENVGKGCCSGAGLEFSIREHGEFFWRSNTTTCRLHGTQLPGTALCQLHLLQEVQSARVPGML